MSSNNQVVILKKEGKYEIHHHLCVDNDFEPSEDSLLRKEDSLVEAIKYAQKFCNKYPYVEYGYSILNQEIN